ncbi:MAG TPA: MBL fold metallo-hydrolase [Hyphomicrobiaceae bacterium]|nr:MBL fold metallo-hydrolase [Hyphomicrobiaceae bacterium]
MHVRFWGTRGSLPKPGPDTLRFGGNTSCVEVRTAADTLVIVDCGSGLHGLGQALAAGAKPALKGHILISHTHWDHIQGIPFFVPFFVPGNEWDIYAPRGLGQSVQDTLAGQMQYAYFPVRLDQMGAKIRYHELIEGSFQIGDVTVKTRYMNHTALTLGFRLEVGGAALVYASDHEPFQRNLASGKGEILGQDREHCEFLAGADLVIHDAQFTLNEYADKIGWGHSTVEYAVAMCKAAGAARLALTHHDPLRTDYAIEQIVRHARDNQCGKAPDLDIFAAAEGQSIELRARGDTSPLTVSNETMISDAPALVSPLLLMAVKDPVAADTIREAAQADDIAVVESGSVTEALAAAKSVQPSLIILEWEAGDPDTLGLNTRAHGIPDERANDVPIIVVADQEEALAGIKTEVAGWLIRPFSAAYARTRIRACLLRTTCHWERALTSQDEEQRLAVLHGLSILDTPPEERFDQITRLAASSLNVPMALVSLVDRERQWFKSTYGLDVAETSRETSFCSHAVSSREALVVPDTIHDPRFSDNPLVTQGPRIRFYAGCPIFVGESCVGTVCVLDHRPRQIDAEALSLLRYLASLVEMELCRSQSMNE